MPLVATDLRYQYAGQDTPVLDGLSLEVRPGEVVALCGAARTGRSTVLSLLTGLMPPLDGSVSVDGVAATAHDARGRVGLLLQNADEGLFGLTVREDVMFAPRQLALPDADVLRRADDALKAVQLDPATFGMRSPFSLSGGQRRRAAMAGVMAMKPTYLLLDEPFSGLDPQGRREIVAVIHDIATRGFGEHTGILVALSDLELAVHLANRIVILDAGCAAWSGDVADFVTHTPDVECWGLRQPELVALAIKLRGAGWELPVEDASASALSGAIAEHVWSTRS